MAVPEDKVTRPHDFTGCWTLDKQRSDSFDPLLALQGISWVKRRAAGLITVTERVRQQVDANGVDHLRVDQRIIGGIKGGEEHLRLDGQARESEDRNFGSVVEQCGWSDLSEIDDAFLVSGWRFSGSDDSTATTGKGQLVKQHTTCEKGGWERTVLWGFADIEGQCFHVRRIRCHSRDRVVHCKTVYTWAGPLQ